MPSSILLAHAVRGGVVDNIHLGSMTVVDLDGRVLASVGDPEKVAYIRSAGKPLQAIALVEAGGAEKYGLEPAELAIICASHSGGEPQVAAVRRVLAKAGVPESALRAGSGIRDNCSGKHAGMLALAKMLGLPLEGYRRPDHPVQQRILEVVADMCGLPASEIRVGVDGCGAPIFAMPIRNMALAYARLANPDGLPPARAAACRLIAAAVIAHPEMVGGIAWRECTGEKLVGKAGASGCYCVGAIGQGRGFAMKIDDGSSEGLYPAMFEMLRRQGFISADEHERLLATRPLLIKNRAGEPVGQIELLF